MTPEELQQQLVLSGISCRVKGDEVLVETCWFCESHKFKLELNPILGVFNCWVCNAGRGQRLEKLLLERLGLEIHLPFNPHARRPAPTSTAPKGFTSVPAHDVHLAAHYLNRRGVGRSAAAQYGLVVCTAPNHRLVHRLVIPIHEFWSGDLIGYIGRSVTNQRPKFLSTLASRVVAGYRVQSWQRACVIVEGFLDGIAVHQAGYHAAILSGTTVPGVREFAARLPLKTPLVLMLDGDAETKAENLRWKLDPIRPGPVYTATLPPGSDPADFTPLTLHRLITKTIGG